MCVNRGARESWGRGMLAPPSSASRLGDAGARSVTPTLEHSGTLCLSWGSSQP